MKYRKTEFSTWKVADAVGCFKTSMNQILECMQNIPALDLVQRAGEAKNILDELKVEESGSSKNMTQHTLLSFELFIFVFRRIQFILCPHRGFPFLPSIYAQAPCRDCDTRQG